MRGETDGTEDIKLLRRQIDECDNRILELLAERMRVCREIGKYKKEQNMTVFHRYGEILEKRGAWAMSSGLDAENVAKIFEIIHQESVRQQLDIINQ